MKTRMKYRMIVILILTVGLNVAHGADQNIQQGNNVADQSEIVIPLPSKNSPEFCNVGFYSQTLYFPFLTKKRAEMKSDRQLFEDYLRTIC